MSGALRVAHRRVSCCRLVNEGGRPSENVLPPRLLDAHCSSGAEREGQRACDAENDGVLMRLQEYESYCMTLGDSKSLSKRVQGHRHITVHG